MDRAACLTQQPRSWDAKKREAGTELWAHPERWAEPQAQHEDKRDGAALGSWPPHGGGRADGLRAPRLVTRWAQTEGTCVPPEPGPQSPPTWPSSRLWTFTVTYLRFCDVSGEGAAPRDTAGCDTCDRPPEKPPPAGPGEPGLQTTISAASAFPGAREFPPGPKPQVHKVQTRATQEGACARDRCPGRGVPTCSGFGTQIETGARETRLEPSVVGFEGGSGSSLSPRPTYHRVPLLGAWPSLSRPGGGRSRLSLSGAAGRAAPWEASPAVVSYGASAAAAPARLTPLPSWPSLASRFRRRSCPHSQPRGRVNSQPGPVG